MRNTNYEIIDIEDRKQWDEFVTNRPESNFLQSFSFIEFHKRLGHKITRRAVVRDDQIIAVYAGYREPARRGAHLAIPGGPLMEWADMQVVRMVFRDIKSQAEKLDCVFARVRPQLEKSAKSMELMKSLGAKKAPMYLSVEHAGILDLTKSEEELLADMRRQTRYTIRRTEKDGVKISTTRDPEAIRSFYDIEVATAERQKFIPFSFKFLRTQFDEFAKHDEALLYTAKFEGEVLAQNFMIFYGPEASYHYAVSTEAGTKISGSPLMHLHAIREAKKRGCTRYNFWGIVDENDTKHRFFGVSTFKRGFGVTELKYTPAHDIIVSPLKYYTLTWPVESLRARIRHVK